MPNNRKTLIKRDVPRLIDEWQIAPKLWDAVRYEVDHRNEEGQFIRMSEGLNIKQRKKVIKGT